MHHIAVRAVHALLILTALLALAPAAASAGTAGVVDLTGDDGQPVRALLFVAAPGETNSTELSYESGTVTVSDTLAGGVQAGDGCQQIVTAGSRDARCPTDGLQIAVLSLGDGNDVQAVPNLDRLQRACPLPLLVDAGEGNDVVVTCRDADTVAELGGGDDRLFVGTTAGVEARLGAGNDVVSSFNGAVFGQTGSYDGGPGDDVLIGTTAKEAFLGGDGRDRVEFPYNRVEANLDGQPGDAPEGDHIHGDVEELAGSVDGSVLSGNDAPNALVSGGPGVTLRGLGGDDVLVGSDYGETIDGGSGADRITGGFGDDVIDPGAGTDTVEADRQADDGFAAGNDTIRARDGEIDRIGCNIGADTAIVDQNDVTDACESVDRSAAPAGPVVATAPQQPRATTPRRSQAPSPIRELRVTKASLRKALRKGLAVRVTTSRASTVQLVARYKGRVVARGTVKTRAGRAVAARLRFTSDGRRRLSRVRRAALRITATAPGGPPRTTTIALKR